MPWANSSASPKHPLEPGPVSETSLRKSKNEESPSIKKGLDLQRDDATATPPLCPRRPCRRSSRRSRRTPRCPWLASLRMDVCSVTPRLRAMTFHQLIVNALPPGQAGVSHGTRAGQEQRQLGDACPRGRRKHRAAEKEYAFASIIPVEECGAWPPEGEPASVRPQGIQGGNATWRPESSHRTRYPNGACASAMRLSFTVRLRSFRMISIECATRGNTKIR